MGADQHGGQFRKVPRAARLSLGDDEWPAAALEAFVLQPIPPKPEPQPTLSSSTFRVVLMDGTEEVVELLGAAVVRGARDAMTRLDAADWGHPLDRVRSIERVEAKATT